MKLDLSKSKAYAGGSGSALSLLVTEGLADKTTIVTQSGGPGRPCNVCGGVSYALA